MIRREKETPAEHPQKRGKGDETRETEHTDHAEREQRNHARPRALVG